MTLRVDKELLRERMKTVVDKFINRLDGCNSKCMSLDDLLEAVNLIEEKLDEDEDRKLEVNIPHIDNVTKWSDTNNKHDTRITIYIKAREDK